MDANRETALAKRTVTKLPESDRQAVAIWIEKLLQIAKSATGKMEKGNGCRCNYEKQQDSTPFCETHRRRTQAGGLG